MGNGSDGWLSTGATTASSVIMARANPPGVGITASSRTIGYGSPAAAARRNSSSASPADDRPVGRICQLPNISSRISRCVWLSSTTSTRRP